jgi:hypothetical protein
MKKREPYSTFINISIVSLVMVVVEKGGVVVVGGVEANYIMTIFILFVFPSVMIIIWR